MGEQEGKRKEAAAGAELLNISRILENTPMVQLEIPRKKS